MKNKDREIYDEIKKKFGSNRQADEVFTDKTYWGSVPVNEDGEPRELSRANPDVLPESAGRWYFEPTSAQAEQLEAVTRANLTAQERQVLGLCADGFTLERIGRKLGLKKDGVYSALKRARRKILKVLSTQKALGGQ